MANMRKLAEQTAPGKRRRRQLELVGQKNIAESRRPAHSEAMEFSLQERDAIAVRSPADCSLAALHQLRVALRSRIPATVTRGTLRASTHGAPMSTTFTPDYLARAAEQLGWDDTPAGQQKRQEDLALLQELMAVSKRAADHAPE